MAGYKSAHPMRANAMELGGYQHLVGGVTYGSWGATIRPTIDAWRLVPENMFDGPVYIRPHDERAIEQGLRERGDLTGLLVRVHHDRMVCQDRSLVGMELPKHVLSMPIAKEWNRSHGRTGWRAFDCTKDRPRWASLDGHPVVVYQGKNGREARALIWRTPGGRIEDLLLADDVDLDDASGAAALETGEQLCLLV